MLTIRPIKPARRKSGPSEFHARRDRVLFGNASHCEYRDEELRVPVAALAASYGGVWWLYNLRALSFRCDGEDVERSRRLEVGQVWTIGPMAFEVVTAPKQSIQSEPPRCTVVLEGVNDAGGTESVKLTGDFLIGSSGMCDLPASRVLKLAARHALLTAASGEWFIHDLTGDGGLINDMPWEHYCRLQHTDRISVGRLRLTVLCPDRPRSEGNQPAAQADTQTERYTIVDAPAANRAGVELSGADSQTKAFAKDLLVRIHSYRESSPPPPRSWRLTYRRLRCAPMLAQIETDVISGFVDRALEQLAELLEADPWNDHLLITLARICDAARWDTLCLKALHTIYEHDPTNEVSLRSMARLLQAAGQHDPECLRRAAVLWQKVIALNPHEQEAVKGTIRQLEVEFHATKLDRNPQGE